jgi:hypothetical protein
MPIASHGSPGARSTLEGSAKSIGVLVVALVACGGGPKPPDPARYQAMSEEERCEATAPRATKCIDELLAADLRDLASAVGSEVEAAAAAMERDDRPLGDREALTIHQIRCETAETYPDAVLACWSESGCDAFARCVIAQGKTLGLFRRPDPAQLTSKEAGCKATQRRREQCARALGDAFATKQAAEMKPPERVEAAEICAIDGVNEAMVACWNIAPCDQFAACVRGKVTPR